MKIYDVDFVIRKKKFFMVTASAIVRIPKAKLISVHFI